MNDEETVFFGLLAWDVRRGASPLFVHWRSEAFLSPRWVRFGVEKGECVVDLVVLGGGGWEQAGAEGIEKG